MTPEQERALALARARKRKAEAEAQAPAMSVAGDMQFPDDPSLMGPQLTGKDANLKRKNDAITAKQRLDRLAREQTAEERRARIDPVREAAGTAGRAATLQGLQDTPAWAMGLGGPSATLAGNAASEQVYDDAGVMSSAKAAEIRGLNSVALGIPAMVNKDFREDVGQAGRDQPGAALAGDIAGYLLPGEAAWQAGRGAYNATLRPVVNAFAPKGGSAVARGTRMGQRYLEQVAGWAGQNALFQGTVGESTAAAEEGRAPTLESAGERAQAGAADPINILGPAALMGLNRLREFATTGGRSATPRSVAEEVAGRTGGASGSGSVLDASRVGGPVDGRAERLLVRMLGDAGYTRNDIAGALAAFDQLADQATDLPALTARLKDVFIDKLGPRAEQVVQDFLQGAGVSKGGTAGQTVADAVTQDYGRLSQFLEDSANARLGAGSRYDTLTGAQQEMSRIGKEGYERVFSQAAPDAAAVDDLKGVLDFYSTSELATPLRQIAAGKMLNVEQMIKQDPRRAAHWMQMAAQRKAQEAADAGNDVLAGAYRDMRENILTRLEQPGVTPGYQQARMQFGDEFGVEQAVTFGSRFFTKVADSVGVRQIADDLRNLTPDQQEAALLSIRDELLRIAGRHREGAPPRLSQVGNEQSLAGLETVVGERGGQLANDIRFVEQRLDRLRGIDSRTNSRTTSNTEARAFADRSVSNPIVRKVGAALNAFGGDAALASVASGGAVPPIFSIRAAARGLGDKLVKGRQGKIDDVTSLLMRDVGPQPRPSMPGDDLPPLTSRGSSGGAPPASNAFSEISSNGQMVEGPNARAPQGAPIRSNGPVGNAFAEGAFGSLGGSAYGSQNDITGDGQINMDDTFAGGLMGGVGLPLASRVTQAIGTAARGPARPSNAFARTPDEQRLVESLRDPRMAEGDPVANARMLDEWSPEGGQAIRTNGLGGAPKTPEQAAKFETPGSPEWEAAKANGLDMSQAGRMARAKEMGFDTDTVLYHGTGADFDQFAKTTKASNPVTGPGVYLTNLQDEAAGYAKGKGANVMPLMVRGKLFDMDHGTGSPELRAIESRAYREGGGRDQAWAKIHEELKAQGYTGIRYRNRPSDFASQDGDVVVIFDPSNIRSINAAFDPDKAASPILTAGAPFLVGGAGLGVAAGQDKKPRNAFAEDR